MSILYYGACNGCAECIHCGLSGQIYSTVECDCCHETIKEDDKLYSFEETEHLCKDCMFKPFLKEYGLAGYLSEDELEDELYSAWLNFLLEHEESYPYDGYTSPFDEDWERDR